VSDLVYRRSRDVMQLRGEAGLFKDLSLFTVLSFVLADQRSLDFDQGNNCASQPNGCVDATNSTTLRDGILPGYGTQLPSTTVFRGPTRRGFEYWGLGANWAVFNQARDDTKPTWILHFETRLSLAEDMRFESGRAHQEHGRGTAGTRCLTKLGFGPGRMPSRQGWSFGPHSTQAVGLRRAVVARVEVERALVR